MEEEEKLAASGHAKETIGYLAISQVFIDAFLLNLNLCDRTLLNKNQNYYNIIAFFLNHGDRS